MWQPHQKAWALAQRATWPEVVFCAVTCQLHAQTPALTLRSSVRDMISVALTSGFVIFVQNW